ncbi:hypothetical protein HDU76_001039 [Blyttiomyces sp. JEL0837]|nr:hypothetical protein HDU76_001039 [Blyttiomyces sp. JEL0837]
MLLKACALTDSANNTSLAPNFVFSPASVTILKFRSRQWGLLESTQVVQYINLVFTEVPAPYKTRLFAIFMLEDGLTNAGVDWISNDECTIQTVTLKTEFTQILASIYKQQLREIGQYKSTFVGSNYDEHLKTSLQVAALLHRNHLLREHYAGSESPTLQSDLLQTIAESCCDRYLSIEKSVWPLDSDLDAKTVIRKSANMIASFIRELNMDRTMFRRYLRDVVDVYQVTGVIFWMLIVERLQKVENVIVGSGAGVDGISFRDLVKLHRGLTIMATSIPNRVEEIRGFHEQALTFVKFLIEQVTNKINVELFSDPLTPTIFNEPMEEILNEPEENTSFDDASDSDSQEYVTVNEAVENTQLSSIINAIDGLELNTPADHSEDSTPNIDSRPMLISRFGDTACFICWGDFNDDDTSVRQMRGCGHAFHRECLQSWVLRSVGGLRCPLCRSQVEI